MRVRCLPLLRVGPVLFRKPSWEAPVAERVESETLCLVWQEVEMLLERGRRGDKLLSSFAYANT